MLPIYLNGNAKGAIRKDRPFRLVHILMGRIGDWSQGPY